MPTFFAGLLAFGLVAANVSVRHGSASPVERDLAAARAALKHAKGPPEAAVSLAEKALAFAGDSVPRQAEAHLLLGLALSRLADVGPAEQASERRQAARTHLRQAEALGVAEADQPRLCYALGRLLYQTDGDPRQAAGYLSHGLPQGADNLGEGYGLLAQVYLRLPTPDLERALQANQKQLDQGNDEKALAPARVLRGDILLRLERYPEAVKVLERVGPAAPAEIRLRARSLQAQACERAGLWARAVPLWQELLQGPAQPPGGKAHVLYTLGVCYLQSQPPEPEQARMAWQQAAQEDGEDGQAAALGLAELDLADPAPNLAAVADALKRVVDSVAAPADYQNKLVSLEKAREIFEAALRAALEGQQLEPAERLAELYRKVAAPGAAEERFAAAAEGLARQLEQRAGQSGGAEAVVLQEKARAQWRTAARAAERAAAVRGGDQPDDLWRAAQGYRKAQDNDKAVAVLERLVAMPAVPRERRAEFWFTLAEARRALDRKDDALKAYLECTNFSDSAFSYRARYQVAREWIEQKQLPQAEELLVQNLQIINPQADRKVYEQTLYRLAALLYQEGKYDQACGRLAFAVTEYPTNPEALALRDSLGECYRKLGGQEQERAADVMNPARGQVISDRETKRAYYEGKRQDWLAEALKTYQQIKEDLKGRAARRALSPEETNLMRRAAFALPDIELERNNAAEALRLYSELVQLYPRRMESLLACQRIGRCWTVLLNSAPDRAHQMLPDVLAVIRQLQGDLGAIPDAAFPAASPRAVWQQFFRDFIAHLERVKEGPRQDT